MSQLYALLTGINNYHPNSSIVNDLSGCVNDVNNLKTFLEKQFPAGNIVTLLNEQATYKNVVAHFGKDFLLKAGKDDIVLFAYSGHGSQEFAAPEFRPYSTSNLQETLVLYDSRTPNGLDLADKELAILIERIAEKGAHVVVILDSCHSGSGTRTIDDVVLSNVRQTPNREKTRALSSYLEGEYVKRGNYSPPSSRHILLSACDKKEKAYEITGNRGLFSKTLTDILTKEGGKLSYADLFIKCQMAMLPVSSAQHPRFETHGLFNGYDGFLGLTNSVKSATIEVSFDNNEWNVSLGAVNGLPMNSNTPATFEIFQKGKSLGFANTEMVGLDKSTLKIPANLRLKKKENYQAKMLSLPVPKINYRVKGTKLQIEKALVALNKFKSIYFDLLDTDFSAPYSLDITSNKIQIIREADKKLIRSIEGNDDEKMYKDAFGHLEHIARWTRTVELDNANTEMNREDILFHFKPNNVVRESPDNEFVVDILEGEKLPFTFEIQNNSNSPRHCMLFYAGENYEFTPMNPIDELSDSKPIIIDKIGKNKLMLFLGIDTEANDRRVLKHESVDIFKLFISIKETQLSGANLKIEGFSIGNTVSYEEPEKRTKGNRELAAKAVPGLSYGDTKNQQEDPNDWYCITLKVRIVARKSVVSAQDISLQGDLLKIAGHPDFQANISFGELNSGSRSIEDMGLMVDLAKKTGTEVFSFSEFKPKSTLRSGTSKNIEPKFNMLELSNLQNEKSLAKNPLKLEIKANLKNTATLEEMLLPVTFDGEHFIPVGKVERLDNGNALIEISQIPDIKDRQRSLTKALKLCFLKLVLNKEAVQELSWVDYGKPKMERKKEGLAAEVAKAQNILLVIHGIIGDTAGMAECMRGVYQNEQLGKNKIDLVLSFDYENLNTPIEETAKRLKEMLKKAGISAESGKKITILAHSMGGLVSRYFIEFLDGKEVVKHLIMAGTPNAGSNIAKITTYRDYLITLLTLALNSPWSIPAAATLLAITKNTKILTFTLAQMKPGEDNHFLQNFMQTSDPKIKYSVVAGDLGRYLAKYESKKTLMDRFYALEATIVFGKNEPNDIAVSAKSIKTIPENRKPAPKCIDVSAHHLNYFEESESVATIISLLK